MTPRTNATTASPDSTTEKATVRGEALAEKVRALLHEGAVRRITIRNEEGHTVMEVPVTAGLVAAVVAPVLVAVAAVAALANSWEIEVDRDPSGDPADPAPPV